MNRLSCLAAAAAIVLLSWNASAFVTGGFTGPYGVVVDPATNYIYVSNVNGDPNARDGNGFISRLKGDGSIDQLHFIDGTARKIALNAPKGMAIIGTTLYVADIDKLHAFDLLTGNLLFDVNFGTLPVQHFYDVKIGPDNALYVADGPGNTIYRVDVPKMHEVTTLVSGDQLGQPHSVVWFAPRQIFAVAGWSSGQITVYDRTGKRQPSASVFLRTLEGLDADDSGNMYAASTGLNAVYKIGPNLAVYGFQIGVTTPAGIAFHRAGGELIAVSTESNTVQSFSIKPPPSKEQELVPLPPIIGGAPAAGQEQKPAEKPAPQPTPSAQATPPASTEKPAPAASEKPAAGTAQATPEKPAAAPPPATTEKPAPAAPQATTEKPAPAAASTPAAAPASAQAKTTAPEKPAPSPTPSAK